MKKTKIVATIGPATLNKDVLREMILSGLNGFWVATTKNGKDIANFDTTLVNCEIFYLALQKL